MTAPDDQPDDKPAGPDKAPPRKKQRAGDHTKSAMTPQECVAAYVAMGRDRSWRKLHAALKKTGRKPPSIPTLLAWGKAAKPQTWDEQAVEFDARVASGLEAELIGRVVKTTADLVERCVSVANVSLIQAEQQARDGRAAYTDLVEGAERVTKLAELLTGKPTERTESTPAATAADRVKRLEDEFATGKPPAPAKPADGAGENDGAAGNPASDPPIVH